MKRTLFIVIALVLLISPQISNAQDASLDEGQLGLVDLILYKSESLLLGDAPAKPEANPERWKVAKAATQQSDDFKVQNLNKYVNSSKSFNTTKTALLPGITDATIALLTEPPASTGYYVADLRQNFIPNQQSAYAQGIGFASLSPFLGIWKIARNIAYFFMIIIFMVVGFAIMFRAKLNPQTVVSIEQALPSLVVTLVLISLSYAIAGLMIDVMYLFLYIVIGIFGTTLYGGGYTEAVDVVFSSFLSTILGEMISEEGLMIGGYEGISEIVKSALIPDGNNPMAEAVAGLVGKTGGVLFSLIFSIIMLVTAFRVFFKLLTAYAQVLMLIITAPLRFLMNAFPGSNAFVNWVKALAGQLAVFPAVALTIFVTLTILNTSSGSGGFVPPMVGGTDASSVLKLVALAILLATPNIIDSVQGLFGVNEQESAFGGAAIGGALGGALGATASTAARPFKAAGGLAMGYAGGVTSDLVGAQASKTFRNLPGIKGLEDQRLERRVESRASEQQKFNQIMSEKGLDIYGNKKQKSDDSEDDGSPIVD